MRATYLRRIYLRKYVKIFAEKRVHISRNTRTYLPEIRLRFCGNKFKKTRKIAPCGTFFHNLSHLPTFTFNTLFNSG